MAFQSAGIDAPYTRIDDENLLDMANPEMGDIEVQVDSIEYFKQERRWPDRHAGRYIDDDPSQREYRMHEQSKKGLTHCVQCVFLSLSLNIDTDQELLGTVNLALCLGVDEMVLRQCGFASQKESNQ